MKTAENMTLEELQRLRERVAKPEATKANRQKKREKFKKLL